MSQLTTVRNEPPQDKSFRYNSLVPRELFRFADSETSTYAAVDAGSAYCFESGALEAVGSQCRVIRIIAEMTWEDET